MEFKNDIDYSIDNGTYHERGYLKDGVIYRGLNQQSYDLGLDRDYLQDEQKIQEFVERLEKDFDLILILEKFHESLVLLAELLQVNIEFMISIPRKVKPFSGQVCKYQPNYYNYNCIFAF